MEQIKSFLSRQGQTGNVLILGEGESINELAFYLEHTLKTGKSVVTAQKDPVVIRNMIKEHEICTLYFDNNRVETVKRITDIQVRYLIGRIQMEEDYCNLWEQYREHAEHIYIARERVGRRKRDVDRYEILEWDRVEYPIELSVVIPVYNVEKYLPECIESLTTWKAPYVEYLFIDDGSVDRSGEMIEAYALKDSRVKHIRKTNGGCASARNLGLEKAAGRYIGFVDADDYVDEKMFRKLLMRAIMGNYELAYCGYQEYFQSTGSISKVLNDCLKEPYLTGTYRDDQVQRLVINTRIAIWRCIYKREFLDREHIKFHEELKRFDDLPFRIECCFRAKSAVCLPEYLYYYRLDRPGQDVSCSDKKLFVHFLIFDLLDEWVMKMKNQRLIDYLQVVKLHTHAFALERIDRKYYKKYLKKARKQLDRTAGMLRTLCLMLVYGGKNHIGWYLRSGSLRRWR